MPDVMKPVDGQPWPAGVFLRDSPTWSPSGIIGTPAAAYGSGDGALSFSVAGSVITVLLSLFRGRSRGAFYERTGSSWSSGAAATADSLATPAYPLSTGSNPRRDRMVLRREIGTQKVYPFIILGTPATNPVAAALVQSETGTYWDTPMFSWTIAGNSSTAISNIVDERGWVDPGAASAGPEFSSIAARDAHFPAPTVNTVCMVNGLVHTYDGTGWRWQRSFVVSASTDANGSVVVTHNLGATPTGVQLTRGSYAADATTDARVNALGSTTFSFIVANSSGAGLGNNPVTFYATAFV